MLSAYDKWLPLGEVQVSASGLLESTVWLEPSSDWFSGHFEECAVVPGVAILTFVAEVVRRRGHGQGRNLEVSGFSKVRFRRVVFPEERIHISVVAMPPGSEAELQFHVTCEGDNVAQGALKVKENRAGGGH